MELTLSLCGFYRRVFFVNSEYLGATLIRIGKDVFC